MMRMLLAALMMAITTPASADIIVLTSGGTKPALATLAEQWARETGKKVKIVDGTVAFTVNAVTTKAAGDLVVLPFPQFDDLATSYRPNTTKPIGRVHFGLAQAAGKPKPDISTLPKFIAVLKAGESVGYTDPKTGSAAGKWVADLLARPEFEGVVSRTVIGMPGWAIPREGTQYALGPLSEEVTIPGVEAVGPLPAPIAKHFDYAGAVLRVATEPEEAAQFLAYITDARARSHWSDTGLEPK